MFLQVEKISKRYNQNNDHWILQDINFEQKHHQKIALSGASGAGKTTLLKIIAGWEQPDAGNVYFKGNKVKGPDEQLLPGHKGIAFLSQHFELWNNYTIAEILDYNNQLEKQAAETLFAICRIEHLLHRKTNEVSGGERQRVALARLLIMQPQLIILDEPFSNLDFDHKQILKTVLAEIAQNQELNFIMASHDPMDTLPWVDTIVILENGHIIQQGSPHEIYYHPVNTYSAGLFGDFNIIPASMAALLALQSTNAQSTDNFILRPHQIELHPHSNGLITGTVKEVQFLGSYDMIVVHTSQAGDLKVMEQHTTLQPGNQVTVTLKNQPIISF
ncbi:MAG: ABC transporter ATP-binding protein [Hydrotalea flava]|uniref:ABC transporter ATP-binding protein n=1 Tax=Hydrotalea TaxID=1004300 RepID=UPI000945D826|nr:MULTISPECIES: ABC transporter ATP-binding protein [Hydrotalea]MBY0348775.1 ABC transporter ATP-binding protein [Hydrotalea flava]RWZ89073.1 MAG: ABC transporter ATP-binding protein [Hydrotalea sp. AMD]GHV28913.1 ABC transporter ATP-binding protein [Clostridia bacterium]